MRFLFLNQYFPPDAAPTGVLLAELAKSLSERGHEVRFVSSAQGYHDPNKQESRIKRELRALWQMLVQGWKMEPSPEIIVSSTSPPLLLCVATILSMRHRAKSVHWLMDMYPELATALGEIRAGFFSKILKSAMQWAYRKTDLIVVLDDDMARKVGEYGVRAEVIPPWISAELIHSHLPTTMASLPRSWIYSGNLGRAHEWETLLETQSILEREGDEWTLRIQGVGPARPAAQERARELGLKRCEWLPFAEQKELVAALLQNSVVVVTQRPEAQGLLWPSKLALLNSLPRPILWIGAVEGAIASGLRLNPQNGVFAPGESKAIAGWLLTIPIPSDAQPDLAKAAMDRAAALEKWGEMMARLF